MTGPNPHVEIGTRIVLTAMPDDPDPVPVGSVGTVVGIVCDNQNDPKHLDQFWMTWDNGRTLNLAPSVDRFVLLGS